MPSPIAPRRAVTVLAAALRIVELGGARERQAAVGALRARFEGRTGAFAPDDAWFEERSRAFWCDAVTRGRFGSRGRGRPHAGRARMARPSRARAPRPLSRGRAAHGGRGARARRRVERRRAGANAHRRRVAGRARRHRPGSSSTGASSARTSRSSSRCCPVRSFTRGTRPPPSKRSSPPRAAKDLTTDDTLDALLRMERSLRALSRVKAAYAYRLEALAAPDAHGAAHLPVRRAAKSPT